jgi:hypothetical protein
MQVYEIRILKSPGFPTFTLAGNYLSDLAAVRLARKMARGKHFEVWRDLECVTGLARLARHKNP